MYRLMILLASILALSACDGGSSTKESSKNPIVLAIDNGCMGCHAAAITVVGPAWTLVSKRYKNEPGAKAFLIDKINKGGKGNWNDKTGGKSMPAYEGRISEENIGLLVDYILALP